MTLLVSLRGTNGLVVASDSRGTFGDPRGITAQNDSQKKLYTASKYSVILTSGAGELGASLIQEVLQNIQSQKAVGTTAVMEVTRTVVRTKYSDWFARFAIQAIPNLASPVRPDLALVVAGYDVSAAGQATEQKIYQLVAQLDFAPLLHNHGFAVAGVAQYGLYLLNRLYENDLSVEQLIPLAAYVITETASQDGKVGGRVQMATITPDAGCIELRQEEVDGIVAKNQAVNKSLRELFRK